MKLKIAAALVFLLALIGGGLWFKDYKPVQDIANEPLSFDCEVNLGVLLSVQGPVGQVLATVGQLAVKHFNLAGGVKGCEVKYLLRDTEGDPAIATAAARNLVDVEKVPALMGAMKSDVSMAVMKSVAIPERVVQVSCCSSSVRFTEMAMRGETKGLWFRTNASTRANTAIAAKITLDSGYRKTAVFHLDDKISREYAEKYQADVKALGGSIVAVTDNGLNKQNYIESVRQLLKSDPDSLLIETDLSEGVVFTREWLAAGGTKNIILPPHFRAPAYIDGVGAAKLKSVIGYDTAQQKVPSVKRFNELYYYEFNREPVSPGLHVTYDAVMVILLAMEASDTLDGPTIAENIRKVTDPEGEEIYPGDYRLAKQLLAEGKTIRYVGASGYLNFDQNGDVQTPMSVWSVVNGEPVETDYLTIDDMSTLIDRLR